MAYELMTWALVREPYMVGQRVDGTKAFVADFEGATSRGIPDLGVLYTVTDTKVYLKTVRFAHDGVVIHSAMFSTLAA